jgi:hypothetical protein
MGAHCARELLSPGFAVAAGGRSVVTHGVIAPPAFAGGAIIVEPSYAKQIA